RLRENTAAGYLLISKEIGVLARDSLNCQFISSCTSHSPWVLDHSRVSEQSVLKRIGNHSKAHDVLSVATVPQALNWTIEGGVIPVIPNSCGMASIGKRMEKEGHA
ncbi:MAG: hypothetical protein WB384_23550, partial [Candidatus Sulfotelmatobacter sp.]